MQCIRRHKLTATVQHSLRRALPYLAETVPKIPTRCKTYTCQCTRERSGMEAFSVRPPGKHQCPFPENSAKAVFQSGEEDDRTRISSWTRRRDNVFLQLLEASLRPRRTPRT